MHKTYIILNLTSRVIEIYHIGNFYFQNDFCNTLHLLHVIQVYVTCNRFTIPLHRLCELVIEPRRRSRQTNEVTCRHLAWFQAISPTVESVTHMLVIAAQ